MGHFENMKVIKYRIGSTNDKNSSQHKIRFPDFRLLKNPSKTFDHLELYYRSTKSSLKDREILEKLNMENVNCINLKVNTMKLELFKYEKK